LSFRRRIINIVANAKNHHQTQIPSFVSKIINTFGNYKYSYATKNNKNIINGWTDCDLSKIGVEQVKNSLESIKKIEIDNIYTSDLKRAIKTSEIISRGDININKL
jgi:hypothetical protein